MPSPETNRSKVVARLERDGWQGRGGGAHDVYKHPARPGRIVVPRHRTLSPGVARVIARSRAGSIHRRLFMRYIALVDGNAGAYGVVVPDLPGCTSAGPTTDEALRTAVEAVR